MTHHPGPAEVDASVDEAGEPGVKPPGSSSFLTSWRARLRFLLAVLASRPLFAVGYIIVFAVILLAIFAPWIAPYSPEKANPTDYL